MRELRGSRREQEREREREREREQEQEQEQDARPVSVRLFAPATFQLITKISSPCATGEPPSRGVRGESASIELIIDLGHKERQCFRVERHCLRARRPAFSCGLTGGRAGNPSPPPAPANTGGTQVVAKTLRWLLGSCATTG